ncbi:hypothetical protein ACX80N_01710 [Arthrobacter sp. MDT2-16]
MAMSDGVGAAVPLRVSVVADEPPGADTAVRVPPVDDGRAPDPGEAVAWSRPDDALPGYENPAILRAGDSGQTTTCVAAGGPQTDLSGLDGAGDGGGE